MNASNIYPKLCEIFKENEINFELLNNLELENISNTQNTIKIYILQFLIDKNDKKANIKESCDIWFIKDKDQKEFLIYNYIELLTKLAKLKDLSKINLYQDLEIFINSQIGAEVFFILSIVNKFFLPDIINLLFVGFVLGCEKEFIKKNYIKNLGDLLFMVKSDIIIDPEMNIASINKENLEALNLYIFFLLYKKKDEKSIFELKNYLTDTNPATIDIYKYYQNAQKSKMFKLIFINQVDEDNTEVYKSKTADLKKAINIKIKHNPNVFDNSSSEESGEESIEQSDNEQEESKIFFSNPLQSSNDSYFSFSRNIDKNESLNKKFEIMESENYIINENPDENSNKISEKENKISDIKCKEENESSKKINKMKEPLKNINGKNIFENKEVIGVNDHSNNKSENFFNCNNIHEISLEIKKEINIINKNTELINNEHIEEVNLKNKNIKKEEWKNLFKIDEISIEVGKKNNMSNKEIKVENIIINNISISENNLEKDTNSQTSINMMINNEDENIFEIINNYVEYPKLSDLKLGNDDTNKNIDNYSNLNSSLLIMQLKEKVGNLKYLLRTSFFDIGNTVKNIILENKIKQHSITNLRLEILINFLKNPNIINIKRKIIEVIYFHLYFENSEYFQLNDDYHPSFQNLEELEKLINSNLINDNKNEKMKKDLEIIKNEKLVLQNKAKVSMLQKEQKKITKIEENKKKKLNITKSFLDFYKSFLNNPVHLGENTANLYLLPRSMFNSEVKAIEYIFDLESVINGKDDENNEIIGLSGKNNIVNLNNIYNDKKIFNIDEALNILFSFNSRFNYIDDKTSLIIKKKDQEFKKEINEYKEFYQDFFMINTGSTEDKKCSIFTNEINDKINDCVNTFSIEVLNRLNELIGKISEGKIKEEKKKIIFNIKQFFKKFIDHCSINIVKKCEFPDLNVLMFILSAKILIINRISEFFDKTGKGFMKKIELKRIEYNETIKKIKSNLKELKKIIQKNNNFENIIYQQWNNKIKVKYDKEKYSLEKIKSYLSKYIKGPLNLDMKYTYDSRFCHWAIKHGFGNYYFIN